MTDRSRSRRRFGRTLAVLASGTLAGCSFTGTVPPVSVYNATETTQTVSVRISRLPADDVVLDESFSLEAGESREYGDVFTESGQKRIDVSAEGLEDAYQWRAGASPGSSGVSVSIDEGGIDIGEVAI